MPDVDWETPCYGTVDWEKVVEPDSKLIYRIEEGSWILTFVGTVLAGAAGTLTYESLRPWIQRKVESYRDEDDDVHTQVGRELKDLFPFVSYADVFIGQRHSRAEEKLSEIREFLENPGDTDGSVYDNDHWGGYSTNELFQTLEFVIATNIALSNEGPERILSNSSLSTDFTGDLIAVGGPIANLYTRNLMYGDSVDLPYRYNLNPDDGSTDISEMEPLELRDVGLNDDDGFERRPNWSLIAQNGTVPEIEDISTIPERRGDTWIRDYFTIIKAPNIHPDISATYGSQPKVLSVSGCHGFGTRAAIRALQDPGVLEVLEAEAGDGYFQALGRVKRRPDAGLEEAQISVPAEHVQLLDVN